MPPCSPTNSRSVPGALVMSRPLLKVSLGKAYQRAGLVVEHLFWFNRVGTLGWWFHGRVRRVKRIPPGQLKTLNALVPLLRLERFLPLPFGQSVIAVGTPA